MLQYDKKKQAQRTSNTKQTAQTKQQAISFPPLPAITYATTTQLKEEWDIQNKNTEKQLPHNFDPVQAFGLTKKTYSNEPSLQSYKYNPIQKKEESNSTERQLPHNFDPVQAFGLTKKTYSNEPPLPSYKYNPIQKKENKTGLPDNLKSGIESLSGMSMDDVKVHYNSSKPSQLQAHAFAQGTDIHVASGQEKHLPHEAWHVAQQKQGRVKPTTQMNGVNINDDKGLEREADVMGGKALQMQEKEDFTQLKQTSIKSTKNIPIQGMWWTWISGVWYADDPSTPNPVPGHIGARNGDRYDDTPVAPPPIVFTYTYDPHGDKHFTGKTSQASQWDSVKATVNSGLRGDVIANQATLVANSPANTITTFYLTKQDDGEIGTVGKSGGKRTDVYTVQIDVDMTNNTITYHGYPDQKGATIGLGFSAKTKPFPYV